MSLVNANDSSDAWVNVGNASKGVSVYFIGPYVEHDEITFLDVSFVKRKDSYPAFVPIQLTKLQMSDGR